MDLEELLTCDAWYISGNKWQLCKVVSNVLGFAEVKLYTGYSATGKAHKGTNGYRWIVEATK